MSIPMAKRQWELWQQIAVGLTILLTKPKEVRLVMHDGTEIPCTCTFRCLDREGYAMWSAFPEDTEVVRLGQVREVEVGEVPPWCGSIDVYVSDDQPNAAGGNSGAHSSSG